MRISEGIRIGSKGKHQIKGQYYNKSGGVCAVGALMTFGEIDFLTRFPALLKTPPDFNRDLITIIADKNDVGETFEQIISWLESIGQ